MEGWGKIGVQSASVLYPNSCYNESCYIEVQVYWGIHVWEIAVLLAVAGDVFNGVSLCCPFSHEMSWMRSGT